MGLQTVLVDGIRRVDLLRSSGQRFSKKLTASAYADVTSVLGQLNTSVGGLNEEEATARLKQSGPNEVAREKQLSPLARLWDNVKNPLVILLLALAVVSYL